MPVTGLPFVLVSLGCSDSCWQGVFIGSNRAGSHSLCLTDGRFRLTRPASSQLPQKYNTTPPERKGQG